MIHIDPSWQDSIPTSPVDIGEKGLDGRDTNGLVAIRSNDRTAGVFRVNVIKNVTEFAQDGIGDKIRLHPNIAEALGYRGKLNSLLYSDIRIDLDINVGNEMVAPCKELYIYSDDASVDRIGKYLKENNALVHNIKEIRNIDASLVEFDVVKMSPGSYHTTLVTSDTNIIRAERPSEDTSSASSSSSEPPSSESSERRANRSESTGDDGGHSRSTSSPEDIRNVPDDFIEPVTPDTSFTEIAGLDDVKRRSSVISELADESFERRIENKFGSDFASGEEGNAVLLYGPPGCGKTMVSEAIATEFRNRLQEEDKDVVFLPVKGSDILGPMSGMSDRRVSKAFEIARNAAKEGFAILFLDEVEALIQSRSGSNVASHEKKLTSTFLQEMNKLGENVLVMAATNVPFNIDSAAGRRFKTEIFVPHPGAEGMADFWRKKIEETDSIKLSEKLRSQDYQDLGDLSADFTPAEIDDRILGSEVQSEIVLKLQRGEQFELTKQYLKDKLKDAEPRDIDRYVSDISDEMQSGKAQGYEKLEKYVNKYVDESPVDTIDSFEKQLLNLLQSSENVMSKSKEEMGKPSNNE